MNILITGNMGYVGSRLVEYLSSKYKNYNLIGLDTGFFSNCLTGTETTPEVYTKKQYFLDLRNSNKFKLNDKIDAVVHLAAISNDPIGNFNKKITNDINTIASKNFIKKLIKFNKTRKIIFSSSCSIYGNTGSIKKNENSELQPLTAYAKSKVDFEKFLINLNGEINTTSLRFATACGTSPRLRLDLVLNDFVSSAYFKNQIDILSDGEANRPLIDTLDMCRAIDWALHRKNNIKHICVNVGSKKNNYKIKDLAKLVSKKFKNCKINILGKSNPDSRSYIVNFDLYSKVASQFKPTVSIDKSINDLIKLMKKMEIFNLKYRNNEILRLNKLKILIKNKKITKNFIWK